MNKHNRYANTGSIGTNVPKNGDYSNLLNYCTVITHVLYKIKFYSADDCYSLVLPMQDTVNLRKRFDYIKFSLKTTHLQFDNFIAHPTS